MITNNITGIEQKSKNLTFKNLRKARNAVSQLAKNNAYSINEPNERFIKNAIQKLSKVGESKNIKFLIDTAAKSTYSTNIKLEHQPKNNWKTLLLTAATSAVALLTTITEKNKFSETIEDLEKEKGLNNIEKEILDLREQLLAVVDLEQINNSSEESYIKEFIKNLDYLIISSETTLEHKKYILERLNYFMSEDYEINPQLKDKKSIVLAEMVNDMTINVPGNKTPNIKAINQHRHGMCAAISIVRKKLAYEDKINFVDGILSELDSSDKIMVYDRNQLGSGIKIPVDKVKVDFDTAIKNGYRIIDASTMHWMQVAQMTGLNNSAFNDYIPFDKENYDVKTDSFLNVKIDEPDLEKAQEYYQALSYTLNLLKKYKANQLKRNEKVVDIKLAQEENLKLSTQYGNLLKDIIRKEFPMLNNAKVQELFSLLVSQEKANSGKIVQGDVYSYIPNEEPSIKKDKTKKLILDTTGIENIQNENLDKIFELINDYNTIKADLRTPKKPSKIAEAQSLYKIAAAFRYQVIKSLEEKGTFYNLVQREGLTNKESTLFAHIDNLINKLETNSPNSDLIIERAMNVFEDINPTKENVINSLQELKTVLNNLMTTELDGIYKSLTIGSRHESMIAWLNNLSTFIEIGDKKETKIYAKMFGVKNDKESLNKFINNYIEKLQNKDETAYIEIFDKMGYTSQLEYVGTLFKDVLNKLMEEDNKDAVLEFVIANNIENLEDESLITNKLEFIKQNVNSIANCLYVITKELEILDKNGEVLYTGDLKTTLIKNLENKKFIAPSKNLKILQEHFNNINKYKTTDEFGKARGIIKDPTLLKFSKQEMETLNETKKDINAMLDYVQNEFSIMRKEMKDSLEELNRIIGVNRGKYWIAEGSSGLYTEEQIRLLEYMTGRYHYSTKDLKEAIEQIKTNPYSGISSSSVYHNENGWHAQYIADIKPVTVKVKDKNGQIKEETKEVLFHDNTWGASEHENTWIDAAGLKRTDYNDFRGGSLGYITDNMMRNGNYVDRILNEMLLTPKENNIKSRQYKRLMPQDDRDKIPQYGKIILQGKSPETKDLAAQIHDALFVHSSTNLILLEQLLKSDFSLTDAIMDDVMHQGTDKTNLIDFSNLSKEELQEKITFAKTAGKNWKPTYEKIKQRILSDSPNAIKTEEDYKNLPNDDYLKVIIEKMALKEGGYIAGLESIIALVRNVEELNTIREVQKQNAIKAFKYSFGKDNPTGLVKYLDELNMEKLDEQYNNILEKYNIKLSEDAYCAPLEKLKIDISKFNGSLKTTIDLIMVDIIEKLEKNISDKNAISELIPLFKDFIYEKSYFNLSDLNSSEPDTKEYEHIIKFIDREFKPLDDEEFVTIYRRIQDMTSEEFEKEILPRIKTEDTGIKNINGWDIIKQLKMHREKENIDLMNTIFYDSLIEDLDKQEKTPTTNKYQKLTISPRYLISKEFNTLYRNIKNDLSMLGFEKMFNKYKDKNIREYGAYPAYPQTDLFHEEFVKKSMNNLTETFEKNTDLINVFNRQKENYNIAHQLTDLKSKIKPETKISGDNFIALNKFFGDIVTMNKKDESIKISVEAAENALELEEDSVFKNYIPFIDTIINEFDKFEQTTSIETIDKVIKSKKLQIEAMKKVFKKSLIQEKYRGRIGEVLNKYEQALINEDKVGINEWKNILHAQLIAYHILQNPEELLDSYILSHAKVPEEKALEKRIDDETDLTPYKDTYKSLLHRALDYARLLEVQSIIMDSLSDGLAINAKTKFNKYMIDLAQGKYEMGSGESVITMVNSLVLDYQSDTALLFLEKLGLSEIYVESIGKEFDYDDIRKTLNKIHTTMMNFISYQKIMTPIFSTVMESFSDPDVDYELVLENFKNIIYDMGEKHGFEKEKLDILAECIPIAKTAFEENPSSNKKALFETILAKTTQEFSDAISDSVDEMDSELNADQTIVGLIQQINLNEKSNAYKVRETIIEKFSELTEYRNSLLEILNAYSADNDLQE